MPFEQIPYTNFHGTNQDWMIQQIKQMIADWASYRENLDAAWAAYQQNLNTDWADYQENINNWRQALDAAFNELRTYVHDYFDNLDVQQEINNKLDEFLEDGTLDSILLPYFNTYTAQINNTVLTQNNKISTLETRVNNFLENTGTLGTEKDPELIDIRVGADDTVYATAGKAVRDQITELNDNLINVSEGFYPLFFKTFKNSYINKNTGVLEPYNGWTASDYINCEGLTSLYINTTVASSYGAFYADKSEDTYVAPLSIVVGDNIKWIPTNAKYFRLSNTNEGFESTTLLNKEYSNITALINADSVINAGLKNIGDYIIGEYVDNETGNFVKSTNYKRTGYIPISDYVNKVIYFTSNYRTPYCCFYNANKEKIISFIIYIGETYVTVPDDAVYCAFSYSRYNNALVTMYDPTFTALKEIGFSNIRDINLKNLDRTDILTQMIQKPLFLVYTDIHGYPDNLKRIASFYDKNLKSNVSYPICLGDMVRDQATDDISWLDTDFGNASLKVIGNHDVLVTGTLPGITSIEAYNRYIAPDVSNWGVTQPANAATNGYTYYYKDTTYADGTVRMIVLDEYFYDETQHNWFVDTLADANTNSYSVIVCQHQSNVYNNLATPLNDKWAFATPGMGFDLFRYDAGYAGEYANAAENRAMAVDAFIGNGGKFICWMSGHTHSDQSHTFEKTHGKQLSLVFSNASMSMTSSYRIYDYSCDCFQYVAVDLAKGYIYVLRIGTAIDKWFHKNKFMCYDYVNHTVVEYY